jgi:hypothetical protein
MESIRRNEGRLPSSAFVELPASDTLILPLCGGSCQVVTCHRGVSKANAKSVDPELGGLLAQKMLAMLVPYTLVSEMLTNALSTAGSSPQMNP